MAQDEDQNQDQESDFATVLFIIYPKISLLIPFSRVLWSIWYSISYKDENIDILRGQGANLLCKLVCVHLLEWTPGCLGGFLSLSTLNLMETGFAREKFIDEKSYYKIDKFDVIFI